MLPGKDLLCQTLDLMKSLLVRAKVSERSIEKLKEDCTDEMLSLRIMFVTSLKEGPWKFANKTWSLLPEEVWERYDTFGFYGLAEQIELSTRLKYLRDAFQAGYQTFSAKRVKNVRTPTPERGTNEDRAKLVKEGKLPVRNMPGLPPVTPDESVPAGPKTDSNSSTLQQSQPPHGKQEAFPDLHRDQEDSDEESAESK